MLNGTLSTLAGDCEVARPSQVEEQVKALEVIAKNLHEVINSLTQKLHCVIRGYQDENEKPEMKVPEELLVPLANNLRSTERSINDSVKRLYEMNAHIELPSS